jgi:hypothetical protein
MTEETNTMNDGVEITVEQSKHRDYAGALFHARFSEKSLATMAEKGTPIYEVVSKRVRILKDTTIPAPQELGQYFVTDIEAISKAVEVDVRNAAKTL